MLDVKGRKSVMRVFKYQEPCQEIVSEIEQKRGGFYYMSRVFATEKFRVAKTRLSKKTNPKTADVDWKNNEW